MRITNSMIMNNAGGNINGTKVLVDKRNTQMTTQKKIQRPSEDPVIAVRSLRLQTTLSKVNQYYEKNIPDAESWMNVTETALNNIKDIVTNMRTLANRGATETLTQDDRNTILSQMKALQEQVYNEGNADYAGRTVFTGYRTDKSLTFVEGDSKTTYNICEPSSADSITRSRYYTNLVDVPTNPTEVAAEPTDAMDMTKTEYNRLRLAYDSIGELNAFTYTIDGTDYVTNSFEEKTASFTFSDGTTATADYKVASAGITNSASTVVNHPFAYANYPNELAAQRAAIEKAMSILDSGHNAVIYADDNGVYVNESYSEGSGVDDGDFLIFDDEEDWDTYCKSVSGSEETGKVVGDNDIVLIKSTGEMVLGDNIASRFMTKNATFKSDYTKTGFAAGELRPEYYFDCSQLTDSTGAGVGGYDPATMTPYSVFNGVNSAGDALSMEQRGTIFDKQDDDGNLIRYDINYTVAQNQELTVNLEAGECIDHNIYQDMGDMINAVEWSIDAHDKVDKIKAMMRQDQYADDTSQANLQKWLEAAQKEADYYDDNLSKLYSTELGICDNYLEDVNLSITKIGCKGDQLAMTKTRMSNQQETVQELQSTNDDMDLSNIILRYTAAYTAYQSSLTAAGRLGQQTLLNYI